MRWAEQRSQRLSGIRPDYAHSYWTPPLTPRLAFDLESSQIENKLQLPALVSLTDHDDIQAPLLLRSVPSARHIPISLEWTVPFYESAFHIGVHNLPSATGQQWMDRLRAFTALSVAGRNPHLLREIMAELDEIPNTLIVFNHPMWDLYRVGKERHEVLVNEFLAVYGQYIHALELNGLRDWKENREAAELAGRWNQLTISGGDRHGVEPNANVNLTRATCFTGFVHEVRRERQSHVLYMPQYAEPWKHRILQSTLDAIRDYPHFPEGARRWDQRVYHPDSKGEMRPLVELWTSERRVAPAWIRTILACVRMMGQAPLSGTLRYAWDDSAKMRAALAKQEG
ncbi:hypothetical protein GWR55_12935 [Edaphobacter sp. 12200R-103]|nr:hypothetical protein GWR55_12935 [Edaphobacter sp. 12200R-103]